MAKQSPYFTGKHWSIQIWSIQWESENGIHV